MSGDESTRPRLLDTYCCQGGASAGYHLAGFDVVGVDINPQPRYPFEFHRGDAIEFIKEHGHEFDAIHASPPCQGYSLCQRIQGRDHPDLIAATRDALAATGLPCIIENVAEARPQLVDPAELCGCMFPGLNTYRPRLFETSFPLDVPPHRAHTRATVKMGRPLREGDWYHAVGNFSGVAYVRANMGADWMDRDGLRESIPPRYAALVGAQLLAHLATERAA
jgi:DNA (cytosine-5)-methyltransferase 1